ncbi:n-acetyl-gamma-glutamyl-phosphate reductase [Clostridium sp. CAG:448]|nr:n-acetyl-gamma-glutamyl-phosphate reductase [Clostridium sp. CAG:448]
MTFAETVDENGFLSAASMAGKDSLQISIAGNQERMLLLAVYDNLGKGASGAALECLNIVLGTEPTKGLCL